jgi:uncharacterized membrane protein YdcZ (DUF606 family)
MKALGIILIVAGILMFIFSGFSFNTKEKVADVGPIEINKTEHHKVNWPMYAAGIAVVSGIVVLIAGQRRTA